MFRYILAPLDGSSLAECVLPHMVAIARAFDARATLLQVLSRSEGAGQFVDPIGWQMGKAQAQNYLEGVNARLRAAGLQCDYQLVDGQPANSIIEFVNQRQVELVILSSHGRSGLSIWNVSGVVHKIIQKANLPTMIVRAYQAIPQDLANLSYGTILVPLDSSQRAECALAAAARLASFYQARLLMAHVVSRPEMPRRTTPTQEEITLADQLTERNRAEAEKYLKQIENRLSSKEVNLQTRLLIRKNVASALHELVDQEKVDLVIMSAHGYSGETRWPYGNVVEKFVTYGSTPLLIYQDFKPGELRDAHMEGLVAQHEGH
ncbi:MAG: universal stress protein [Anaerolineales bacterium]|nr:universal stress protein [Anaerolineales bacterium]